jgi:hypothetical protein
VDQQFAEAGGPVPPQEEQVAVVLGACVLAGDEDRFAGGWSGHHPKPDRRIKPPGSPPTALVRAGFTTAALASSTVGVATAVATLCLIHPELRSGDHENAGAPNPRKR